MNDEKPAQAFACAGSVFEKFGIAVERQTAGELREQALHIGAVVFVIRRGKVFSCRSDIGYRSAFIQIGMINRQNTIQKMLYRYSVIVRDRGQIHFFIPLDKQA